MDADLRADRRPHLAFYPAYWSRPLANTSASWDLEALRERRRTGSGPAVELVPHATEPVDAASELRIVVAPGDLLCFSGAHLHASVPNTTGLTRFSVEVRTVHVDDLLSATGAPNIDGAAPHTPLDWFTRMTDGTPLPALLEP